MTPASLIITTYNRPDALHLVLLSVAQQHTLPQEVIIADDGSGEETRTLIEQHQQNFPTTLRHVWQEDKGFRAARGRNLATAASNYPYLIFLDGDMILHPEFVRSHINKAKKNQWIQGSRVLLSEKTSLWAMQHEQYEFSFWQKGITNRLNSLHAPILSPIFSYYNNNPFKVRSANMSCWKDDLVKVNGFNENFVGWGREDSELALRLYRAGIRRLHLKFAAVGYHLFHPENPSKVGLAQNDLIYQQTEKSGTFFCENGLQKHLP
ncbi:MAG: glycosyltransferase family 2 protein [Chitinophagales bacterium]|nr:glycosyltransferase family 2 protein [Bacteroidota bacterium]MCB9042275.1 glycosyltransferase family 2 protein [Chitinophagales bacterium]